MILNVTLKNDKLYIELHDCYKEKDIVKTKGYTYNSFGPYWEKEITKDTFNGEVFDILTTFGLKKSQLTATKEVNDFITK